MIRSDDHLAAVAGEAIVNDLPPTRNPHKRQLNDCISHALMTVDVFRWLLIRTDLTGLAQKMVIKETICIFGNVCDSLAKDALYGNTTGPRNQPGGC